MNAFPHTYSPIPVSKHVHFQARLVASYYMFLRNYPIDGVVEEAPWAAYGSTAQAKVHFVLLLFLEENDDLKTN